MVLPQIVNRILQKQFGLLKVAEAAITLTAKQAAYNSGRVIMIHGQRDGSPRSVHLNLFLPTNGAHAALRGQHSVVLLRRYTVILFQVVAAMKLIIIFAPALRIIAISIIAPRFRPRREFTLSASMLDKMIWLAFADFNDWPKVRLFMLFNQETARAPERKAGKCSHLSASGNE